MFVIGLATSLLGNIIIGAGQCLQKYGLNKLKENKSFKENSRLNSSYWVLGFVMCYFGELCGNWVGLSLASAAVIMPLGIISVLVNAFLASLYLGETMDEKQKEGYALIICGVLLILLMAPKSDGEVVSKLVTMTDWILFLNNSAFLTVILLLLAAALLSVYLLIVSKYQGILNFVSTCGLFATITVLTSKAISLYFRVSLSGGSSEDPTASRSALFVLFSTLVLAVAGQEIFRQQAYTKFNVSQFQPLLYSSFNVISVISNELVFKELPSTWISWFQFYVAFLAGIVIILQGSLFVQKDAVEVSKVKYQTE
jgi:uncharacterized membrane protein